MANYALVNIWENIRKTIYVLVALGQIFCLFDLYLVILIWYNIRSDPVDKMSRKPTVIKSFF